MDERECVWVCDGRREGGRDEQLKKRRMGKDSNAQKGDFLGEVCADSK